MGGNNSTKKGRAEALQRGLGFDNFETVAVKRYLQMHLMAERFVYVREMIAVF
jgi:hypothetical protein